jgi:acetylornithine deacetylase/succinyl-diaminopimelate desuccinylase-like protein
MRIGEDSRGLAPGPVEILQRLIRFDTRNPPGNERDCVLWIDRLLSAEGLQTQLLALDADRPNLVARLPGRGDAPPLLLFGHADVAPVADGWRIPPFEGRTADGWVWGRGALDMKGGVALMLAALLQAQATGLSPAGDVILCVLSDEEAGSVHGARWLVGNHPELFAGVRYAVSEACFPAYFGRRRIHLVQVAEKQICWLRATIRSEAGHAALSRRGGTMARLGRFLSRLDHVRLPVHVTPPAELMLSSIARSLPALARPAVRALLRPGLAGLALRGSGQRRDWLEPLLRNTATATVVRSGDALNVLPASAEVELDGRLLPGFEPADLEAELRPLLPPGTELELVFHDSGPPAPDLSTFPLLEEILREADPGASVAPLLLPGVTDARFFARLGIQTYGFLPLPIPRGVDFLPTIHGADERVPVEAIEFGTRCLVELLRRFR